MYSEIDYTITLLYSALLPASCCAAGSAFLIRKRLASMAGGDQAAL